ncbi:MAG: CAP domain-containing protein [Paracoccaceae bacterium]|nr:CAP domain-containing protein [Paracoccaceae bacterium]
MRRSFLLRRSAALLGAGLLFGLAACVAVVPVPVSRSSTVVSSSSAVVVGQRWPTHAAPGRGPASAQCPAPARATAQTSQLLTLINSERRAKGLPALRRSTRIDTVAHAHACDNASRGSYSHVGSDGADLGQRLRRGGYQLRLAAENTGFGFDTPQKAMNFWMNSPHHRSNILTPGITEIGIGLADGTRPAWVINFAKPR